MGFRIQKRINLGGGLGLNVGKKGMSASFRGKGGSIGSKGYSVKSGISGVSYRGSFGKSKSGCLVVLVIGICISALLFSFVIATT